MMRFLFVISILFLVACSSDDSPAAVCDPAPAPAPEPLRWKRVHALISDLRGALALSADELCFELGEVPCADLHKVSLGGSDPLGLTALYTPMPRPLSTTPTATERVILSACANRVGLDAASGAEAAMVFTHLDLDEPALDPDAGQVASRIGAQIDDLYRRFLGRNPTAEERGAVADLAVDRTGQGASARDFATLACFAVGTTTEFLLY